MKTLILPGYSLKNKDWAEETKRQLDNIGEVEVVYWPHWEIGQSEDNWIEKEADRIIWEIGEDKVNLLAKSVGTMVAMIVLQKKQELVNKLILCGIPLNDLEEGDKKCYERLGGLPAEKVLCIQNREDNHGLFAEVEKFIQGINPRIKIIAKERADHDYPYSQDFMSFLS